ncbi:YesL family protein [Metabacillus malikii]|uniref:Membrane protein YesL n=1 Tax=Metabacillus malikii TaxID=1504265 RepID=A0ABT9ZDU6_9BACI|nr:DUF624 domain-containing protein [Metabacillus malikii]MDQ0230017.1 putative membrane protein YesL [Metabacillus malikii]
MNNKRDFGDGILYSLTNYIYWLALTNLYFILTNCIFIFFFMTLTPSFSNILIYFLALLPSGPAIAALIYSIEKLTRTKELSPTRDFFDGYKKNLKDTFKVWLPILFVYFILIVDLQYLRQSTSDINQILSLVVFMLTLVWTILSINLLIINARYKFRLRDAIKLSIYYAFIKAKHSIGNLLILFITFYLSYVTTNFLILFTASTIAYFIMLNTKEILNDLETNFLEKDSNMTNEQSVSS